MSRTNATPDEYDEISRHLIDLASEKDIWILQARDLGSRARNLDSTRSDYDVQFIFAQSHPDYVLQTSYIDSIERTIPADENSLATEIELDGWNLRKLIGGSELKGHADGLLGSNPSMLEYLASDIEYYNSPGTHGYWDTIEDHTLANFKPYALMKHYGSLAENNYRTYIQNDNETTTDITVKRYLNITQALFKRIYVAETLHMPPMDADKLWTEMTSWVDSDVHQAATLLKTRKRAAEGYQRPSDDTMETLDEWITSQIEHEYDPLDEYIERRPDVDVLREPVADMLEEIY